VQAPGNEGLRSVNDIVVAVTDGRGAHSSQVRPGLRLSHRDGSEQIAGRETGKPSVSLLVAREAQEVGQGHVHVRAHGPGDDGGPAGLLVEDGVVAVVGHAPAAVLPRDGHAEQAHPGGGAVEIARYLPVRLPLAVLGHNLLLEEAAGHGAECLVLVVVEPARHECTTTVAQAVRCSPPACRVQAISTSTSRSPGGSRRPVTLPA
jgi:hypothetical protein